MHRSLYNYCFWISKRKPKLKQKLDGRYFSIFFGWCKISNCNQGSKVDAGARSSRAKTEDDAGAGLKFKKGQNFVLVSFSKHFYPNRQWFIFYSVVLGFKYVEIKKEIREKLGKASISFN